MKKLILNKSYSAKVSTFVRSISMVAMLAMANLMSAQVDCNITMACNDGLQVSLNEDCIAIITPDMILENQNYDNSDYTVIVMDGAGNSVPNATVTTAHIGQSMSVQVQLNGCAASCWGNITVEDKLPPVITGCENLIIDCDDDLSPDGGDLPIVSAADACGSLESLVYSDTEVTNACANDFVKTVTRTWVATDDSGNEATCIQLIYVRRANIADVMFPPNYDDIDEPAFSCAVTLETLPNGAPTPAVTGSPSGASCANIQTYYSDVVFEICGASIKVLRQWVVVDWCTGEEATHNQIIKILDDQAPVCSAQVDFMNEIPTDQGLCTGTFEVPAPNIIFECSEYNYVVGYKLRDENGDPFDEPIYDNITYNSTTGLYTIAGLPQDTSWIVYTITDECGNSSQCFTEVSVIDEEAPTPVCEGYTVVGLEDAGWADIYGSSIDDGSYDNCEVVKYEVRRETTSCGFSSDLQFGEKVNFCCADVDAGYIKVVLRVYDASGNYNDCVVNVNVQDKINPTIECPSDVTIQCTQDYNDMSLTGEAVGYDNCSVSLTKADVVSLDECGKGLVRRTWTATDPQGRSAQCTQRIYVVDSNPFGANNISWPGDLEVNGCDPDGATPEELNSRPILNNVDCTNIAISYDDNVFYNTPDYCIKVLRHWKVVDWCNYDPQNPSFYEYTQKIGFSNSVAPTFASCEDVSLTSTNGDCQEEVSLSVNATDDCTPDAQLVYSYAIDADADGINDLFGNGNSFVRTLPAGNHRVIWTVVDACDNESVCIQHLSIQDTKAPTPICLGEVTWVLGEDGTAEIWASDFNLKSEAACGSDDDLIFSFNAAGTQQVLTFDCSDIPNGIAAEISLQMHVIDASGNSEYCDVTLILQDSGASNACNDQEGGRAEIGGTIVSVDNEGIQNIEVELMDMDATEANMDMTQDEGQYMFEDVAFYGDYAVAPYKNDDAANGVTTLDLVMIQRHILGLTELDSPYKLIAADANGNDKINSADLLTMRKVILGIQTDFGDNNTSWRFIPTTYEIEDPLHPFGFPEQVQFDELYISDENINFTAIKTGDINGNAVTNLQGGDIAETRSGAQALIVANQEFTAGEKVNMDVLANEVKEMVGMQMTIQYDAKKMIYRGINGKAINIENYHVNVSTNLITISWNAIEAKSFSSNDVLFSVAFETIEAGNIAEAITLTNKGISAEFYDESLNTYELTLDVDTREVEVANANTLHQNTPNPFKGMTTVGFDLEESGIATLAIFDIAGKELYRMSNDFSKGYNEMTIDVESLNTTSGILYYTLKAGDFIDTKKMIIIE